VFVAGSEMGIDADDVKTRMAFEMREEFKSCGRAHAGALHTGVDFNVHATAFLHALAHCSDQICFKAGADGKF